MKMNMVLSPLVLFIMTMCMFSSQNSGSIAEHYCENVSAGFNFYSHTDNIVVRQYQIRSAECMWVINDHGSTWCKFQTESARKTKGIVFIVGTNKVSMDKSWYNNDRKARGEFTSKNKLGTIRKAISIGYKIGWFFNWVRNICESWNRNRNSIISCLI